MKNKITLNYGKQLITLTVLLIFFLNLNIFPKAPKDTESKLTLGEKSLNFLILSDWGRDGINDTTKKTPGQLKVAKQLGETAKEINASFLVTCGDNFHGKGVPTASDPLWKVNFENVYTSQSLMIPWYITLGNHDNGGNVEAELEYAKTSNRWIQPSRYFSFEKKINESIVALFVILDSSPFIEEYLKETKDGHHIKGQNTDSQIKWCDSVLKTSNAKWKFVFYHHPA
ncbi:MAG: metallophosphoesterase, partial [FCB group bacterium]